MSKQTEATIIKKSLQGNEFINYSIFIVGVIGLFIIVSVGILFTCLFNWQHCYNNKGDIRDLFNYFIVIGVFLIPLRSFFANKIWNFTFHKLLQSAQDMEKIYKKKICSISEIDEILITTSKTYSIVKSMHTQRKYLSPKILPSDKKNFDRYTNGLSGLAINTLLDLRSDLSIRLTEQQKTLEQAKSEVERNITGTPELNQVSELQRQRLDRQIEQFEELQRVLVKV